MHNLAKLQAIAKRRTVPAHIQLDRLDVTPTKIYLIISGVMRCYIISESGKECNKNFFFPFSFAASLKALISKKPSEIIYETLTETELYEINFQALMDMCKTDLEISNLYSRLLEYAFINYEKRQLELISMDATQRYSRLLQDVPNIDALVPQYHIASYLSITPVQLSRIRKKLKNNTKAE